MYVYMYIYINTHTHTHIHTHIYKTHIYIYIHTYIHTHTFIIHKYTHIHIDTHNTCIHIYIKRKQWRKSWFCIQMLNETNLIDVGSTMPTWTSMWFPLFNGFFEGCECWKIFHIVWHKFPNSRSQVGEWFCAM